MKIREDVVFSKCTGEIIGFVDYGEQSLDKRFQELRKRCKKDSPIGERIVATHMLVVMVRAIFFKMDVPVAQFPTTGLCVMMCYVSVILIIQVCLQMILFTLYGRLLDYFLCQVYRCVVKKNV